MCVVVYKPKNKEMPSKETLFDCFVANPDGAGYMFQKDKKVCIKKGFMTFASFLENLQKDYEDVGKDVDFVLHFRISTQGGVNQPCCHPYKVSKDMDELRLLECESDIGVAHNGIIRLTTDYGSYSSYYDYGYKFVREEPKYNDTMKFITDYMSLIMRSPEDVFDEDKVELVEKLIGSSNKFAVMTPDGVNLIGYFHEIDGIYYSNDYFIGRGSYKTIKDDDSDFDLIDIDDYNASFENQDNEELKDYSYEIGCGYASHCRKCCKFEECYGFSFPEEWQDLEDFEIDQCLDYFYNGYDEETAVELAKAKTKGETK